jgi:hypothetical protein
VIASCRISLLLFGRATLALAVPGRTATPLRSAVHTIGSLPIAV